MASVLNSAVALCSLADLKAFLSADIGDEFNEATLNDNELERIVNGIGQLFQNHTRRLFISAERTQYYDGDGTDTLFINAFPVTSTVSTLSLWVDVEREYATEDKIPAASIILYAEEGKICLDDYVFSAAKQSVKLTYTGGFTLASTLPGDLRLANLMQCAWLWKQKKEKLFGVSSIGIMGSSMSTQELEQGMLPFVKEVLSQYMWWGKY